MSTVISVRVRREVKEGLERLGVNVPEVVRNYLEELWERLRAEVEVEELNRIISERVKPSKPGFSSRSVREDRESL